MSQPEIYTPENLSHVHNRLELLAPAKNADYGIEAIRHGADAVYIGGPHLVRGQRQVTVLKISRDSVLMLINIMLRYSSPSIPF